jgi:hypothetical protein
LVHHHCNDICNYFCDYLRNYLCDNLCDNLCNHVCNYIRNPSNRLYKYLCDTTFNRIFDKRNREQWCR